MKNKKNLIIVSMMAIVAVMAIGYSFFATRLNINATGNITSQWNVYFSNIKVKSTIGNASSKVTPSVSGTTANMEANLALPGDSITYELTLINAGSIGAIIEDIEAKAEGSTAIIYSISGLKIGDKLAGGASKVITIKIEYDSSVTSQPSETSKTLTVTIDAVQDIGQSIVQKDPTVSQSVSLSGAILKNNIAYADNVSSQYVTSSTGINFSQPSSDTNGKGLYYTNDDDGVSYYFRGDVENNYISFGTYPTSTPVYFEAVGPGDRYNSMAECLSAWPEEYGVPCMLRGHASGDPMYWRILRINGDGTIRIVYEGEDMYDNAFEYKYKGISTQYSTQSIDSSYTVGAINDGSEKYVGYTYEQNGQQVDSTIKTVLDSWYTTYLESNYSQYIADSGFCNDRGIYSTEYFDLPAEFSVTEDYYVKIHYNGYNRLINNASPQLICANKHDRYTINTTTGNGLLTKPIGTLTADELIFAGDSTHAQNMNYYLFNGYYGIWTLTPSVYDENGLSIFASANTFFGYHGINSYIYSLPVINLKADVAVTGTGTIDDPYVVQTN